MRIKHIICNLIICSMIAQTLFVPVCTATDASNVSAIISLDEDRVYFSEDFDGDVLPDSIRANSKDNEIKTSDGMLWLSRKGADDNYFYIDILAQTNDTVIQMDVTYATMPYACTLHVKDSADNGGMLSKISTDGSLSADGKIIGQIKKNEMTNIAFVYHDITGMADVYVDGEKKAESVKVSSKAFAGVRSFLLYCGKADSNMDLCIDNLRIYTGSDLNTQLDFSKAEPVAKVNRLTETRNIIGENTVYDLNSSYVYHSGTRYTMTNIPFIVNNQLMVDKGVIEQLENITVTISDSTISIGEKSVNISALKSEPVTKGGITYVGIEDIYSALEKNIYRDELDFFVVSDSAVSYTEKQSFNISTMMLYDHPSKKRLIELYSTKQTQHPRVLADANKFSQFENDGWKTNSHLKLWGENVLAAADKYSSNDIVKYEKTNGKLLNVSRDLYKKARVLSMAYILSHDTKYTQLLWKNLDAAAKFDDWNPGHPLDVSEMCMGFAIAYDWCYNVWTDEQKTTMEQAMLTKGIEFINAAQHGSNRYAHVVGANNRGIVNNAGAAAAAIAIFDKYPDICADLISNTTWAIDNALKCYYPSGEWVEGSAYWAYATEYIANYQTSLKAMFDTDFGISKTKGLDKTAYFALYANGAKASDNFHDSARGSSTLISALYWLSQITGDASLTKYMLKQANSVGGVNDMLWYDTSIQDGDFSYQLDRVFDGKTQYLSMRSSWTDENATILMGHAGEGNVDHGHLDTGTFTLDALGERWAEDIGLEPYLYANSVDENDMHYYYRLAPQGHNCLVINPNENEAGQIKNSFCPITEKYFNADNAYVTVDLNDAYSNYTSSLKRTYKLTNGRKNAVVRDEIVLKSAQDIYWMCQTMADVTILDSNSVMLTQNGKRMKVLFSTNAASIKLTKEEAKPLENSRTFSEQALNTGYSRIQAVLENASGDVYIQAKFIPVSETDTTNRLMNEFDAEGLYAENDEGVTNAALENANMMKKRFSLTKSVLYSDETNTCKNYAYAVKNYDGNAGKALQIKMDSESSASFFDWYFSSFDSARNINKSSFVVEVDIAADSFSKMAVSMRDSSRDGTIGSGFNVVEVSGLDKRITVNGVTEAYTPGKWIKAAIQYNHISYGDGSFSATYTTYIDGVPIAENVPISSIGDTRDGIRFIRFYSATGKAGGGATYLDNIRIYTGQYDETGNTHVACPPPTVILKLDDMRDSNTSRFETAYNLVKKLDIEAGFGVIGEYVTQTVTFEAIRNWYLGGMEIWHHGWHHGNDEYADTKTDDEMAESFAKTLKLIKENCGITITSFGAPGNLAGDNIVRVINEKFPQIKAMMLVKDNKKIANAKILGNQCAIEKDRALVNLDTFKENYDKYRYCDYIVIQSHPSLWADTAAGVKQFEQIMSWLKYEEGCSFETPTQYATGNELDMPSDVTMIDFDAEELNNTDGSSDIDLTVAAQNALEIKNHFDLFPSVIYDGTDENAKTKIYAKDNFSGNMSRVMDMQVAPNSTGYLQYSFDNTDSKIIQKNFVVEAMLAADENLKSISISLMNAQNDGTEGAGFETVTLSGADKLLKAGVNSNSTKAYTEGDWVKIAVEYNQTTDENENPKATYTVYANGEVLAENVSLDNYINSAYQGISYLQITAQSCADSAANVYADNIKVYRGLYNAEKDKPVDFSDSDILIEDGNMDVKNSMTVKEFSETIVLNSAKKMELAAAYAANGEAKSDVDKFGVGDSVFVRRTNGDTIIKYIITDGLADNISIKPTNPNYEITYEMENLSTAENDESVNANGIQLNSEGIGEFYNPNNTTRIKAYAAENLLGNRGKSLKTKNQNAAFYWYFASYRKTDDSIGKAADTAFVCEAMAMVDNAGKQMIGLRDNVTVPGTTIAVMAVTLDGANDAIKVGGETKLTGIRDRWIKVAVQYNPIYNENGDDIVGGMYSVYADGVPIAKNINLGENFKRLRSYQFIGNCTNNVGTQNWDNIRIYAGTYNAANDIVETDYSGTGIWLEDENMCTSLENTVSGLKEKVRSQSANEVTLVYDSNGLVRNDTDKLSAGDTVWVKPQNGDTLRKYSLKQGEATVKEFYTTVNGVKSEKLEAGTIGAYANIKTVEGVKPKLILAVYKNGWLNDIQIAPYNNNDDYNVSIDIADKTNIQIKCMIFNSFVNLKPLCKEISIK